MIHQAISGGASIAPKDVPMLNTPVAIPRSFAGNQVLAELFKCIAFFRTRKTGNNIVYQFLFFVIPHGFKAGFGLRQFFCGVRNLG